MSKSAQNGFSILGQYITDIETDRARRSGSRFPRTVRWLRVAAIAAIAIVASACGGAVDGATATQSQSDSCALEWPSVFGAGAAPIVLVQFGDTAEFETCYREDTEGDYMCHPPQGDCRYAPGN